MKTDNSEFNYPGQYSVLREDYFNESYKSEWLIDNKPAFLALKNGQNIASTIQDRVDNGGNAYDIYRGQIIAGFKDVDNTDVKLDDKIRAWQFVNSEYITELKTDKGTEFIMLKILDLLEKHSIQFSEHIISHPDFMNDVRERIENEYRLAYKGLEVIQQLQAEASFLQEKVLSEMLDSLSPEFVLFLVQRFGKTFLILEFLRRLNERKEKTILVVASKALASNSSFESDKLKFGFMNFKMITISLCTDTAESILDEIVLKLEDLKIDNDTKIVLVTDEADFASSTPNSVKKLDSIKEKFHVRNHILMSGTGIGKFANTTKNTNKLFITVTEIDRIEAFILGQEKRVVIPKYFNIRLKPILQDSKMLNIRQSLSNRKATKKVCNYLYDLVDGNTFDDSSATPLLTANNGTTMVAVSTKNGNDLVNFGRTFEDMYSNEIKILTLSGAGFESNDEKVNNRVAQYRTLKILNEMKIKNDNRRLVIFTNQIGRRSYTIPDIDRVILLKDGELSDSDIQFFSRGGSFKPGKEFYEVVVVSQTDIGLDAVNIDLNKGLGLSDKLADAIVKSNINVNDSHEINSKRLGTIFRYVDFFTYTENDDGNIDIETFKGQNNSLGYNSYLATLQRFKDTVEVTYDTFTNIRGLQISDDTLPQKKINCRTTSGATKQQKEDFKKSNSPQKLDDWQKEQKAFNLKILTYSEFITLLPIVAFEQLELETVDDLLEFEDWDDYLDFAQEDFRVNMKIQEFRNHFESLIGISKGYSVIAITEKIARFNEISLEIDKVLV